ncbi:hypothetical protein SAMN04244560_01926 [Thermoanaerobacter thermohydrosulfuricus]|uniref:Uncharacterized protein n=1 Tax=Thermoanaerobacter thermohydrosulfuricus TaxID=1516 RepID=A0A1G7S6Z3_THETY|nr:hypothetical protein [Thermoanaerobacter thermohydrosulfuricus]SDG18795.1 hypothetical protein SAMN04244560_01926 [Thermoanaerobacter thermohydrosulfuricus]
MRSEVIKLFIDSNKLKENLKFDYKHGKFNDGKLKDLMNFLGSKGFHFERNSPINEYIIDKFVDFLDENKLHFVRDGERQSIFPEYYILPYKEFKNLYRTDKEHLWI